MSTFYQIFKVLHLFLINSLILLVYNPMDTAGFLREYRGRQGDGEWGTSRNHLKARKEKWRQIVKE